jgi:hypothetical protein
MEVGGGLPPSPTPSPPHTHFSAMDEEEGEEKEEEEDKEIREEEGEISPPKLNSWVCHLMKTFCLSILLSIVLIRQGVTYGRIAWSNPKLNFLKNYSLLLRFEISLSEIFGAIFDIFGARTCVSKSKVILYQIPRLSTPKFLGFLDFFLKYAKLLMDS